MSKETPSIREFLEANPLGSRKIYELCEQYKVDLDTPWPPVFPKKEPTVTENLLILRSLWPESHRAGPNAIFRSALFPSLNFQEGRPFLKEQKIYSVDGITVFFTGERFDQSDLDVYLEILHLAGEHPLGTEVTFSAHTVLTSIGRSTGLSDYKWLHSVLIRLSGGIVDMTDHKIRYFGPLLQGGFKDEITKHYTVSINPKFAVFFGYGLWSKIDNQQRRALGRNMTAKALHAYYSTHAAPGPHKVETLAGIADLKDKNPRKTKMRVIAAHETMKEIGFLSDFQSTANTIKADVKPTPSQVRHLVKKGTRKPRRPKQPKE